MSVAAERSRLHECELAAGTREGIAHLPRQRRPKKRSFSA
jgi:hypothetical protein